MGITVGIDAINLRQGGGVTYLVGLLSAANPSRLGVERVIVWSGKATSDQLEKFPWLKVINPKAAEKNVFLRSLWQRYSLSSAALKEGCDVLFVPGGSYRGKFKPVVAMSQNILPFEWRELRRYGLSVTGLRLALLRVTQSLTFRSSQGIIFLSEYAKRSILSQISSSKGDIAVIPHGLTERFLCKPRTQKDITEYSSTRPFRLVYVSIIDLYKHQWAVVEAVVKLRTEYGWPLVLDLIGPKYPPALRRLETSIQEHDPNRAWVRYIGSVPYKELHEFYNRAELGVFASSCENLPIVLLETMASGLPIACSDRGPMPEVLSDAGVYFDPEKPESIADSIKKMISSKDFRATLSARSFKRCELFSWKNCAEQTFSFLAKIAREGKSH